MADRQPLEMAQVQQIIHLSVRVCVCVIHVFTVFHTVLLQVEGYLELYLIRRKVQGYNTLTILDDAYCWEVV